MTKLENIEGIGAAYQEKLVGAGVDSVEGLLEQGATPAGRKALEEKTGIRHDLILKWINHADLFRVKGIGEEYADLLEAVGVDTVAELSKRSPENLLKTMQAKNEEKKLVNRLPSENQVGEWVECAQGLPRIISY